MPPVFGFAGGVITGVSTGVAAGAGIAGAYAAGMTFGATMLSGIAGKLLTTVAMSALQTALQRRSQQGGGLTISTTLRGEQHPETIILGRTATAGQAICPPMWHGDGNRLLTQVVELCSAPGARLERVIIGDDYVELGETPHPDGYGYPVLGDKYGGLIHVKYYDGHQTAADPMLRARYGNHPDRPWTEDMVGHGLCYAILTFRFDRERLAQVPRHRFEMLSIPLYDLRRDSTAGGSGPHRLDDPTTWEPTENPMVAAWNILRGIDLPGGDIWGGQVDPADLPPAVWFAAMNACDAAEALEGGGTEPRYRFGIEAALSQEPAAVLAELLKACAGQVAENGGVWTVRVGGPALPVYIHTDDDVIVSRPQEMDPFPSLSDTWNAVSAQYPDPEALWETRDAPLRTNETWEAADRFGRRTADLVLPAVPYGMQVQRLMRAWIEDERRFARHIQNLPPDATLLEPLDTLAWSSERNGYEAKSFEVAEIVEDVRRCVVQVSTREVDPEDYSWEPGFTLPSVPVTVGTTPLPPAVVSGFAVEPAILTDSDDTARRPAIRLVWDAWILAEGLRWEARLVGQPQDVLRGTTQDLAAGERLLWEGILAAEVYQVRAALITDRPTEWTAWLSVATPDIRLGEADLADPVRAALDEAVAVRAAVNARIDDVVADADAAVEDLTDRVIGAFGPLDVATSLTDRVIGAYGPLDVSASLTDRVIGAYGPLDVAASLTDRVIAAYGPLDVSASLDARIGALDSDMGQRVADIERIDRDLELRQPISIDTAATLDRIAGRVGWLMTQLSLTRRDLADAGIHIDPALGRARIEAVSRIDGRLGEVAVDLDAAKAEIALRATYAEVNGLIAAAQLDPADLPVLDDLTLRISQAEITLSGIDAAIELKADNTVVNGLSVKVTDAEVAIDALAGQIALRVTTSDFDELGERVANAEITLGTIDAPAITLAVQDVRRHGDAIDAGAITTLGGLLAAYRNREILSVDLAYVRQDMRALVDEDRVAMAQLRVDLGAAIDGSVALIEAERIVRTTETTALAEDVVSLRAEVTTAGDLAGVAGDLALSAFAAIDEINRVEADSDSAAARALRQVQLDVGVVTGDLAGTAGALTALEGRVELTEDGIEASISDRRQLTAGIGLAGDDAARLALRDLLLSETGRADLSRGVAQVREDLSARVTEDREAVAQAVLELDAAIGGAVAMISAETVARATALEAEASQRLLLRADLEGTQAGLASEALARADGDSALALRADDLEVRIDAADSGIAAGASATGLLEARVDTVEDETVAQGVAITALEAGLTDAEGGIAANAAATSTLAGRVTTAEGLIDSQASAVTALATGLSDAGGAIAANAAAVSTLDTRVTSAEGTITAYAQRIDDLEVDVTTAEGAISGQAAAVTGLTVRVEATEAGIEAAASDRRQLTAGIVQAGDDAALLSLRDLLLTELGRAELSRGVARVREDLNAQVFEGSEALAARTDQLEARLGSAEGDLAGVAQAGATLAGRVTTAEGLIDAQSSAITALTTGLSDAEGAISANAGATGLLDTRVTSAEGTITSYAQRIDDLEVDVSTAGGAISGQATALDGLTVRVEATEEGIETITQAATTLAGRVTDAEAGLSATGNAVSVLETDLSALAGTVTSQSSAITALEAGLTDAEGGIAANAAATSSLAGRVTTAEGLIDSQSSAITALATGLSDAEGAISANAAATGLLDTRVTSAEGTITSYAQRIDDLEVDVSTAGGAIAGQATALDGLTVRVEATEEGIETITQAATTLAGRVTDAETGLSAAATAVDLLETDVSTLAGSVTSQASAITGLTSSLAATDGNVTAAQAAADAAATLAGGKGKVIVQSAPPDAADRLAQNLWIDTTGGANTPKRWNGSAWVAVTDKVATDAAAAAASALDQVATKAEASAVSGLTTRVTDTEGDVEALSAALLLLESRTGDGFNLVAGAELSRAPLWDAPAGWSMLAPATGTGLRSIGVLRFATAGAVAPAPAARSARLAAIPGQTYRVSFQARGASGDWSVVGGLQWFDAAGAYLSATNLSALAGSGDTLLTREAEIVAPAGAVQARLALAVSLIATTAATVDVAAPVVERVTGALAGTRAALTALDGVITTPGTGIAARTATLEAEAGSLGAQVTTQAAAIATLEGHASATYTFRVGAGGAEAGLELVAADDPVAGPVSALRLRGDHIRLDGDVEVTGGFLANEVLTETAWINTAMIGNAAVQSLQIADQAVTVRAYVFAPAPVIIGATITDTDQILINRRGGFPTQIQFNAQIDAPGNAVCSFYVYRRVGAVTTWFGGPFTVAVGNGGRPDSIGFSLVDFDTGTGPTQYRIAALRPPDVAYTANPRVFLRTLSAQQFQR